MKLQARVPSEEVQEGMIDRGDREIVAISKRGFYVRAIGRGGLLNIERYPFNVRYIPKDDVVVLGFPDAVS